MTKLVRWRINALCPRQVAINNSLSNRCSEPSSPLPRQLVACPIAKIKRIVLMCCLCSAPTHTDYARLSHRKRDKNNLLAAAGGIRMAAHVHYLYEFLVGLNMFESSPVMFCFLHDFVREPTNRGVPLPVRHKSRLWMPINLYAYLW